MNDEQKLRLRVASEQMAAMILDPTLHPDVTREELAVEAVKNADALIAEHERTAKAAPMPEGGVMDRFTPEEVDAAASETESIRVYCGDFNVAGMLRAYAARLREDALDTKMLDFLDAHPQLVLRTGKQAMRPLILAAMREHGGAK